MSAAAKNLLFISYFYPPLGGGGVQRVLQTTRLLPRFGWKPAVLTVDGGRWTSADDSGLSRIPPDVTVERTRYITAAGIKEKLFGRRRLPGTVATLPSDGYEAAPQTLRDRIVSRVRALWQTPDEFIGWYPFAVKRGRGMLARSRFDAIVSSGPPWTAHLIARRLALETGLPWLADFRDGWTLMPCNPHGSGWQYRIEERLERGVLDRADALVFTNPQTQQDYVSRRKVDARKTHTVTNGFDPEGFTGTVEVEKDFVLFYGGTTLGGQRLERLFPALDRFHKRHPDEKVRIEYAGSEGPALAAAAKAAGVEAMFRDLGYLPHAETVRKMRTSAALLLPMMSRDVSRSVYPGKLFEYLAAGRPVFYVGRDGATTDLLRELGMTKFVIGEPGNADVDRAVDEALDELHAAFRTGGTRQPASVVMDIHARFSRVDLTRRFAGILDEISSKRP